MGNATQDRQNEHDAILFALQLLDKMLHSKEQSKETLLHIMESSFTFSRFSQINAIMGKRNNICFKNQCGRVSRTKEVL